MEMRSAALKSIRTCQGFRENFESQREAYGQALMDYKTKLAAAKVLSNEATGEFGVDNDIAADVHIDIYTDAAIDIMPMFISIQIPIPLSISISILVSVWLPIP